MNWRVGKASHHYLTESRVVFGMFFLPWYSVGSASDAAVFRNDCFLEETPLRIPLHSYWCSHTISEGNDCLYETWMYTWAKLIFFWLIERAMDGEDLETFCKLFFLMSCDLFLKEELGRINSWSGTCVFSFLVVLRRTSWKLCSVLCTFFWVILKVFFHCTSTFFFPFFP